MLTNYCYSAGPASRGLISGPCPSWSSLYPHPPLPNVSSLSPESLDREREKPSRLTEEPREEENETATEWGWGMGWGRVLSPRGLAEAARREGWRATQATGRNSPGLGPRLGLFNFEDKLYK